MADYNYIVSTGVIVPDTASLRSEVEAEYKSVFGADLPVTPETPQGVLITAEVESRDGMVRNNAELANQINPDIAGGVWLDAIWALTRGKRRGATRSRLSGVVFSGIPGTIIPAGSLASVASSGARFRTIVNIDLGASGSTFSSMEAVEAGPVAAPVGALTEIASSVLGWETVVNPSAAEIGLSQESDVSSRRRRRNTLALQSVSPQEAIISRIYNLDGVASLSFRANITLADVIIDGVTITSRSIYVCVDGGQNIDIATAILSSSGITDYSGSIVVSVIEPASEQVYLVRFDRPIERTFRARVTVKPSSLDVMTIIPDAIAKGTTGELDGDSGLAVNQDLSAFELAGYINQVEPRIFVTRVETSEDGVTWSSDDVIIKLNEVARLPKSAIQVVVS